MKTVGTVHTHNAEDDLRRIRIVSFSLLYGSFCVREFFDLEDTLPSAIAIKIPLGCLRHIGWPVFHSPKVRAGQNLGNRHIGRIKCGERIIGLISADIFALQLSASFPLLLGPGEARTARRDPRCRCAE